MDWKKLVLDILNIKPEIRTITREVVKEVPIVEEIEVEHISNIDKWCQDRFKERSPIAYKYKRAINGEYYSIFVNQLITPDAFEVQKFKQPYMSLFDDKYKFFFAVGDALAERTTWVDERKIYEMKDYYFYPEETLTGQRKACDCDDVTAVMASIDHENAAMCWGFHDNGIKRYGHAFPIFLHENVAYVIETIGNKSNLVKLDYKEYDPYIIFTKNHTYHVKSGAIFGVRDEL